MNKLKSIFLIIPLLLSLIGCSESQQNGVAADNTQKNVRDADGKSVTPEDQSNDPHDLELTQHIRQSIVDDENLSISAKNVKIITRNGSVTLRGPVNSQKEKDTIYEKAQSIAGIGKVVNKLEIVTQ